MKLTEAQRAVLQFAKRVCDSPEFGQEVDGVCPRRGQSRMFEKLRSLGLLADAGIGVDDRDRDVQLYAVTDAGRAALTVTP